MKVLVSGAAGFIGRATVNELHRRKIDYRLMDLEYGHDVRTVNWFDLLDGCDGVIHLAGILGTHELFNYVEDAIDINTKGTARLLKAAQFKPSDFKYVGISMMDVWDNVYQATKIAGERLAMAWHRHKGMNVSIVRAFNGYGPYQKVHGVQKIVPTFADRAWRNEPIPVWGDGSATTDLVHVDDIARLLVDSLYLPGGEKIDAGTGVAVTVKELAEKIVDYTGSTGGIDYRPMRLGEHELSEPLVAKGAGWDLVDVPQFSWDRVMETVDWYKEPRR